MSTNLYTHTPIIIWSTAVVEKMIPVFASAVDVVKEKKKLTFASKGQKSSFRWSYSSQYPSHLGRESDSGIHSPAEFSQHSGRKQYKTCPNPQQNRTINKKKRPPLMYSEQETGGQRKKLPLVTLYGFTNDSFCDSGKKMKQNKEKKKKRNNL